MKKAFSVDISGTKEVQLAMNNIDEKLRKQLTAELDASALTIERDAKKRVPVDLGRLKNDIKIEIGDPLSKVVYTDVEYAPYVEFGTGKFVNVPPGYEEFALQFKGKKKVTGMKAQPYLIPAFESEKPKLFKRLKAIFK